MIVVFAGSREWKNEGLIKELLEDYDPQHYIIMTGGAKGADTIAHTLAVVGGFRTEVVPADWNKNGKAAGYLRNVEMVDAADEVVVFWDGVSKGSKHTIDLALKNKKHLKVVFDNDKT